MRGEDFGLAEIATWVVVLAGLWILGTAAIAVGVKLAVKILEF